MSASINGEIRRRVEVLQRKRANALSQSLAASRAGRSAEATRLNRRVVELGEHIATLRAKRVSPFKRVSAWFHGDTETLEQTESAARRLGY